MTSSFSPRLLLSLLTLLNAVTFCVYACDKLAARRGGRRVPEATLLLLALLGGWSGALLARHLLRHKTAKPRFTLLFWACVAGNCALFLLLWCWLAA